MVNYAIDSFVWTVQSGLVGGVISIAATVGVVKLVHHLFKGVSRYA